MSLRPIDLDRRDTIIIEKDNDDPRMTLGYITQAWTDIRSYTSNIWQVAAVGMAVIVLALNAIVSSTTSENPLPLWMILVIGVFALLFLALTSYTIAWFRRNIAARVEFISKVEERLIEIKGMRLVVSGQDLFSIKQGPLNYLLLIFYSITLGLGEIIVFIGGEQIILFLNPSIQSEVVVYLSLIFCIWFGEAIILLFERGYYDIRKIEDQAQKQDDHVVSEYQKVVKRGMDLEREMNRKLKEIADKNGYDLKVQVPISDKDGMKRYRLDAVLSSNEFTIPIEAKTTFTPMALEQVRRYLRALNSSFGVIVTEGDSIDDRWIHDSDDSKVASLGSIGVIGIDSDFDILQTWIQKIIQ